MSKTIQYRCPFCGRQLFKWEVGSKITEYTAKDVEIRLIKGFYITQCTKCKVFLEVGKGELREI